MKKVVIIGANDFQNQLILKAKSLGLETHVFAWREGAPGEKTADFFYPVSIVEKEEILKACRAIKPDAVASIASDLAAVTVNFVAAGLGLPCNSGECVRRSTNKLFMRRALLENGVDTPGFVSVGIGDDLKKAVSALSYPLVVKPTDRSGSRAISKCGCFEALAPAVSAAIQSSFEKRAMMEEYIEGDEYSCECISFEGKHTFLALTKKFTTGAPRFIETGHREPAGFSSDMEEKIKESVFHALDALLVTTGASHAEFRVDAEGRVRIIEIGARMGGDCIGSDLVWLSTGKDFVKMVLDTALGQAPDLAPAHPPKTAQVQFILNQDDLDRLRRIQKTAPEAIYRVSEMDEIGSHPVVDSSTRFGYYILACGSAEEAQWLQNL